jgi:hypothetical protein
LLTRILNHVFGLHRVHVALVLRMLRMLLFWAPPYGDLDEFLSSSYGLSLFSSKAVSHLSEGTGAMLDGSLSMSVGELWPGIDQLDKVGPRNASVAPAQN